MSKQTIQANPSQSIRQKVRDMELVNNLLIKEAQQNLFVINALVWRLGLAKFEDVQKVVDDFTEHKRQELLAKQSPNAATNQTEPNKSEETKSV